MTVLKPKQNLQDVAFACLQITQKPSKISRPRPLSLNPCHSRSHKEALKSLPNVYARKIYLQSVWFLVLFLAEQFVSRMAVCICLFVTRTGLRCYYFARLLRRPLLHHNVEGGLHKSLHGTAFEVLLRNKSLHSALCCKRELESTLRARSRLTTVPEGPFLSQILESSSSSTVLDVVDMAMDSSRREKAPAA